MTDQRIPTSTETTGAIPRPRSAPDVSPVPESARWMGWVRFGAVLMVVLGAFAVIEGIAALVAPTTFITADGTVLTITLSGWAWVHIIIGALVVATGIALLGNAPEWARGVGMGVVALNMLVQLAWLPAYPIWSIVMVGLDVLVLYALIVTWGEHRVADR